MPSTSRLGQIKNRTFSCTDVAVLFLLRFTPFLSPIYFVGRDSQTITLNKGVVAGMEN